MKVHMGLGGAGLEQGGGVSFGDGREENGRNGESSWLEVISSRL